MAQLRSRPEKIPFLFPKKTFQSDLTIWIELIQHYADAEKCFLISIVHYKCRKGMEHEFILVRVQHPSGAIALLRLDRSAKPSERASTHKHDTISMASSSYFPAHDQINVSADGTDHSLTKDFEPCIPLRTLTFPENASRPSLAQFSNLLSTITPENYQLYKRACYWFAGATWESLKHQFPHAVVGPEAQKVHPSTYRGITVPQNYTMGPMEKSMTNSCAEKRKMTRRRGCKQIREWRR